MPDAITRLEAADAFFASPLARARETMELARAALGLPPMRYALEPALKELTFGEWEGLTWPQVWNRDPAGARAREIDKWNFAPPGGESYAMLADRLQPWLDGTGRQLRRFPRRRRARLDDADRRRRSRGCRKRRNLARPRHPVRGQRDEVGGVALAFALMAS